MDILRVGGADTRDGSLALSTSGTLPLLPLLVSSDSPLSTPAHLKLPPPFFFNVSVSSITRGSVGGRCSLLACARRSLELLVCVLRLELYSPFSSPPLYRRRRSYSSTTAGELCLDSDAGGEIACVLGTYLLLLKGSLEDGDSGRELSETTESRSENARDSFLMS